MRSKILKSFAAFLAAIILMVTVVNDYSIAAYAEEPGAEAPIEDIKATYRFMNDGAEYDVQIVKNGEELVQPVMPSKEGSVFIGWFDENGAAVEFGTVTIDASVTESYEVIVNAAYSNAVARVYYHDTQGNVVAVEDAPYNTTYTVNTDITISVDADEAVYGWKTTEEDAEAVSSIEIGTEDVNLYPVVKKAVWITFNTNGGNIINPVSVFDGNVGTLPTPVKAGFVFKGWTLNGVAFDATKKLTTDVELTASWEAVVDAVDYKVVHMLENANDAGYSYAESETKSGKPGDMTAAVAKSYEGFSVGTIEQKEISPAGTTVATVYYKRNVYTINFVAKAVKCGLAEHKHTDYKGDCYKLICTNTKKSHTHNKNCYKLICTLTAHTHGNSCYALTCKNNSWFHSHNEDCYKYEAIYSITAKYGADISNMWPGKSGCTVAGLPSSWKIAANSTTSQVGIDKMPAKDTSFYYDEPSGNIECAINYYLQNLNDSGYTKDHSDKFMTNSYNTITEEDLYPIDGYTLNTSKSAKIGDYIYEAEGAEAPTNIYYDRDSFTAVMINQDGSKIEVTKKFEESLTDLTGTVPSTNGVPEGYIFKGWYDNTLGVGTPINFGSMTMPSHNLTAYAVWGPQEFTIDFVTNCDTNIESQIISTGNKVVRPEDPVKEGYSFAGWTCNNLPFNFNTSVVSDMTLVAKWISAQSFSVTYTTDEAGVTTVPTDSRKYIEWSEVTVKGQPTGTPSDKVFLGWNYNGKTYYPGEKFVIHNDTVLTAVFGPVVVDTKLVYSAGAGTGNSYELSVKKNADVTVLNYDAAVLGYSMKGYTFDGWKDANGTSFQAGQTVGIDKIGNNTLTAQWKANEVTITVTPATKTVTYNGETQKLTIYTLASDNSDYSVSNVTYADATVVEGVVVGTYDKTIDLSKFTAAGTENVLAENVHFVFADAGKTTAILEIEKATATVTANDNSKLYNAADPSLTAKVSGTIGSDKLVYTVSREEGEEVGEYVISVTVKADENPNYDVKTVDGKFTINPAKDMKLTVESYDKSYDGASHGEAAIASVANGTKVSYSTDNGATWTTVVPTVKDVTATPVKVIAKAENKNYETVTAEYSLNVSAKSVTVSAENKSQVYGEAEKILTADVTGTVPGEEGMISYTLTRAEGTSVGTYTITAAGDKVQGNYVVEYVDGIYEITKSDKLTVSGTDYSDVYDGAAHGVAATPSATAGTTVKYSVDGGEWTTEVPTITNVGKSVVKVKATNANYEDAETTYTLEVTAKAVTVKAVDNSKTYGETDPKLEATVAGTIGSDKVDYSVTRETGENVGTYTITPAGAEIQGNYSVSYETAIFTINKSGALTVEGTNYEGTYDAKAHGEAATPSVTEGTTVLYSTDNGATWTETVPTITNVGTVTVSVKATNDNYNDSPIATYSLTVTAKAVTVTAVADSKTYGEKDPVFEAKTEGTLGSDTIEYSVSREAGEDVGTYDIIPAGAETQGNYTVNYVNATFEINKSDELTVAGTNYKGTYDASAHGVAANASVAKDTTVYYSVDNGKTWNTEVPTITNVGKTLVLVKAENKNYVDANASYTLEVTAKSVTVKANNLSKVYGTKDETLTAIVDGTLNSDEVIYTLEREAGEDVGDYTITPGGEVEQGNYSVIFETGTYTITKADTLVVNGTPYTGNYDGFEHGEAAIPSVIEGTKVEYSVDGGAWTETVPTITNVGTFNVSVKATNANYKEATTSYTLKVNPKSVTVTADANSKTYGDADPVLTATISGVIGSDTVVYSVVREAGENVGSYTITPSGAETQGNYTVSYETATFTINKSNALTVVGTNYEGTYDAKAHGEAAKPSVAEGTTVYYSVDNGATWTTEVPVRTNAGTTEVMVKAANANYNDSPVATYTLTVNAKAVIVTAVDNSKIYGEEDPVLTATYTGTIGTDSVSYVVKRKVGENVGDYEITVGGAAIQGNYAVSYVSATFTIKKSSELTVVGTNYEGVYDAEAHGEAAKPSVAEGTTVYYSVDNGATWTTEVPVRTNVGTTEVKVMAANANYNDSPVATYTLTVEAKAVTVTAEAKTSVYGEPFETLTAVVDGNLNGDTIVYTLTKAEGENVGTYAITAAGAEYQGNYKVSYVDSVYEITKAGTLTVSGTNYSDVYDAAAHGEAATPSVTEGTTVEYSVDGGAWTTEVPTIEEVGIKTVEVRATNANYLDATTTYTLEVTAKEVTVAAIDNGKVYGDADPELKANVTGLLNDDEVTYTVTREKGEDVVAGGYVITVAGEETQGNYKVTYVPGKFEITKKAATVTADNLEKVYGDADATLTATVEGTVGDDVLDYTIDREAGENVGVYAIVVTEGTNNNYDVTVVDGQYTINKKNVTLTVADATKIVGKADPVFTASTEEGALVGTDTLVYTLVRAVGERIGTYVITANVIEEENPNYNVTVVPGVLTIKAAPKLPEDPEDPEVPEDPDVPVTPTVPDVPVVPTVPDVPVVPVPVVPVVPEEPENPAPEVVIEDEDTPLAPEAQLSESVVEKETPVEVEIEDEDVPLAAADHCFIHWIILANVLIYAVYAVLRSLAMSKKKDEEEQTAEN